MIEFTSPYSRPIGRADVINSGIEAVSNSPAMDYTASGNFSRRVVRARSRHALFLVSADRDS